MFLPGAPDIRKPSEALVRRDRGQYGAEDRGNAGHCQESQGKKKNTTEQLLCLAS